MNARIDNLAKKLMKTEKAMLKSLADAKEKLEAERDAYEFFPFKNEEEMQAEHERRQEVSVDELENQIADVRYDIEKILEKTREKFINQIEEERCVDEKELNDLIEKYISELRREFKL